MLTPSALPEEILIFPLHLGQGSQMSSMTGLWLQLMIIFSNGVNSSITANILRKSKTACAEVWDLNLLPQKNLKIPCIKEFHTGLAEVIRLTMLKSEMKASIPSVYSPGYQY